MTPAQFSTQCVEFWEGQVELPHVEQVCRGIPFAKFHRQLYRKTANQPRAVLRARPSVLFLDDLSPDIPISFHHRGIGRDINRLTRGGYDRAHIGIPKDGKATIQDVVRMTNESVNRGMNVYETAKNDADAMDRYGIAQGLVLNADGRIDTGRSAAAIGNFRRVTGAQGLIDESTGLLTEEGQTRIGNAVLASLVGDANRDVLQKMMSESEHLDMDNERRALMRSAAELMKLSAEKPVYDLRAPLAEALRYYVEWRDRDETMRAEAGKTRAEWTRRTPDGRRLHGVSWADHMSQGDLFRTPSADARILGDLLAASREQRSFDSEDRETTAGKQRAQRLVSDYLADYVANARAANTETVDLFGAQPATRGEILGAQREKNGLMRFSVSVSPTLKKDISEALNTDRSNGNVVKGEKRVVFCETPGLLKYVGMPTAKIYSKAYTLRKIFNDHNVTADQIASMPELLNSPAAVFRDVTGNGFVVLTDANVPDANGESAPMMIYLRPDAEGNYLASAYSRTRNSESQYENLANSGNILYWDKNKVADLALRGEVLSSLSTFSIGDNVVTPERITADIIPQSDVDVNTQSEKKVIG